MPDGISQDYLRINHVSCLKNNNQQAGMLIPLAGYYFYFSREETWGLFLWFLGGGDFFGRFFHFFHSLVELHLG